MSALRFSSALSGLFTFWSMKICKKAKETRAKALFSKSCDWNSRIRKIPLSIKISQGICSSHSTPSAWLILCRLSVLCVLLCVSVVRLGKPVQKQVLTFHFNRIISISSFPKHKGSDGTNFYAHEYVEITVYSLCHHHRCILVNNSIAHIFM